MWHFWTFRARHNKLSIQRRRGSSKTFEFRGCSAVVARTTFVQHHPGRKSNGGRISCKIYLFLMLAPPLPPCDASREAIINSVSLLEFSMCVTTLTINDSKVGPHHKWFSSWNDGSLLWMKEIFLKSSNSWVALIYFRTLRKWSAILGLKFRSSVVLF